MAICKYGNEAKYNGERDDSKLRKYGPGRCFGGTLRHRRPKRSAQCGRCGTKEREKPMSAQAKTSCEESKQIRQARAGSSSNATRQAQVPEKISGIIDHKVVLLAMAGAAVNADCDSCLDMIAPELEGVGMSKADIRSAVESRRFPGAFPKVERLGCFSG